jgi:transcription antitermination factor NusG
VDVDKQTPQWYCIQFNEQRMRGERDAETFLKKTAKEIFGKDLHGISIIGERFDDRTYEMQSEGYFFVLCTNYHTYIPIIKRNIIITKVLPSTDKPEPVDSKEVSTFQNLSPIINKNKFDHGDLVKIRRGYLENLVGIVIGNRQDRYSVLFRLCTRKFIEHLPKSNMVFVGSIEQIAYA